MAEQSRHSHVSGKTRQAMDKEKYWVYVLRCSDGTFYTGQTNDVERRLAEHNAGKHCRYTYQRRPVDLVMERPFATRGDAMRAEMFVKKLSRSDKEALIEHDPKLLEKLDQKAQASGKRKE